MWGAKTAFQAPKTGEMPQIHPEDERQMNGLIGIHSTCSGYKGVIDDQTGSSHE
jgi:hypothetical protein